MRISNIVGRQILDSRGHPTVEADVWLDTGVFGRASVPSGASTGSHEAHELRDGGSQFSGLSVHKAVDNIEQETAAHLHGMRVDDQRALDQAMIELDGTENKSRLGANAILAVSLAASKAAAQARGLLLYSHLNDLAGNPMASLPMPMMNVLNGGKHASDSSDFQEFMIVPHSAQTFADSVRIGAEIFHALKEIIKQHGTTVAVGDEGGFTFPLKARNTEMLDLLVQACRAAGYEPGSEVSFALDVAASEFHDGALYNLAVENRSLDSSGMIEYLAKMSETYPIISIEDGLGEDDWSSWTQLTHRIGHLQLVGDDVLVTNKARLQKAIDLSAGNAILIKPNQIGTLTETIEAVQLAKQHDWRTIISHRSGETEDVTIAHLAIGLGAEQIKTGSLSRSERTSKYNELARIARIDSTLPFVNPHA